SDYLYHGRNELRGVNTGDTLVVSQKDRKGIRMVGPDDVFPEYYILRVAQFDEENPTTPLGEWMRYFKWGYIDPKTKVPALRKALRRLNLMKMSPEERKAYEYALYNKHYEEDIVNTARNEGLFIGEQQGRVSERALIIERMREAGIDTLLITRSSTAKTDNRKATHQTTLIN
ncbi:MAG: hypothetical protein IKM95_06775, partial [Bacteroidales bacterium]|nr:hypothetical protein [Bacteroidales bacterium]